MTEEQAQTKICCAGSAGHWKDDGTPTSGAFYCRGSACMAWRWINQEFYRPTELWSKSKGRRVNSAYSDDSEWRPIAGASPDEPPPGTGFCGLGGKP